MLEAMDISAALTESRTVRNGYGIIPAHTGVLRMTGSDAADFLQRMSTNDFTRFDQALSTLLVTEKGRMIDIVTALPAGPSVLLVTSGGTVGKVKSWLEKFIITEDIELTDVSALRQWFYIVGPQSEERYRALLNEGSHGDVPSRVGFRNVLSQLPWFVIGIEPAADFRPGTAGVSEECGEILRIEEGIPRIPEDTDDLSNPLELGLEQFISFTKGCYTGQEVIARLDTYKKTSRRLRGFLLGGKEGEPVGRGELFGGREKVGFTTSHAWSALMHQEIALGYLNARFNEEKTDFKRSGSGEVIQATVVHLPFRPHGV